MISPSIATRHRRADAITVLATLTCLHTAAAADGALDGTFGLFGAVSVDPPGYTGTAPVRADVDGQGNIVGCVVVNQNPANPFLARLSPSGATDTGFGNGGTLNVALPSGATDLQCNGFAAAADGRLWLGGVGGSNVYVLRRLANGSPDTTFANGGVLALPRTHIDFIEDIKLRPDGSAIVAGERMTASGWRFSVFHVLANGAVDGNFGTDGFQVFDGFSAFMTSTRDDYLTRIALAPDGGIALIGYVKPTATGNSDFAVARLTADGGLDNAFGNSAAVTIAFDLGLSNVDAAFDGRYDSQGRLVIAGRAQRNTAGDTDMAVARLLANGSPDSSFVGGSGKRTIAFDLDGAAGDSAYAIAIQSDGKILLAGYAGHVNATTRDDWAFARLQTNGGLDASFGTGGKVTLGWNLGGGNYDAVHALLPSAGRYIAFGASSTGTSAYSLILARLQNDLIFADPLGG